jgi:hypothetical protein
VEIRQRSRRSPAGWVGTAGSEGEALGGDVGVATCGRRTLALYAAREKKKKECESGREKKVLRAVSFFFSHHFSLVVVVFA